MQLFDRLWVNTPTVGTGAIAIGAALLGFRNFAGAQVPDGAVLPMVVTDANGATELGYYTYTVATSSLARTTIVSSSNGGAAINLSGQATVLHALLAQDLGKFIQGTTGATSTGVASAGQVPVLNARGAIDPTLLSGGNGAVAVYPAGVMSVTGTESVNGSLLQPGTQAASVLYLVTNTNVNVGSYQSLVQGKFGDDQRPIVNRKVKGRGTSQLPTRIQDNDYIFHEQYECTTQSATTPGTDLAGHAGVIDWIVDGNLRSDTFGEVPGSIQIYTGTGISSSSSGADSPNYFGTALAIMANSRQQVAFPGQVYHRQFCMGTRAAGPLNVLRPTPGSTNARVDYGCAVLIGPGSATAGTASMKFDYANSALLTTPEPAAIEVDANAIYYMTDASGHRGQVNTSDKIVAASAVKLSLTGTGTTTVVASFTLPANSLGPNGYLEWDCLISGTVTANEKGVIFGFGPQAATAVIGKSSMNDGTSTAIEAQGRWANRGATNSQIGQGNRRNGVGFASLLTSTIDTTVDQTVNICLYLATSTETVNLESYTVRAVYRA